ncbi:hypothetical protein YC2023_092370 [Brassica napus]
MSDENEMDRRRRRSMVQVRRTKPPRFLIQVKPLLCGIINVFSVWLGVINAILASVLSIKNCLLLYVECVTGERQRSRVRDRGHG